jgi:antirestriction protein ArdC
MSYNSYDHDNLQPAERLRIERNIYFNENSADLSALTAFPVERLRAMREDSAAAEQAIFDKLREATAEWETQAANTLSLDKAIQYVRTPPVKHTANQWRQTDNGYHELSNTVYKMTYHVYENTRYDKATDKSIPYAWDLTWSVRTNNPDGYRGERIAGQDRKRYGNKVDMEKYLAGRIKAYSHLFTEISPAIPQEHKNSFTVNGQLLPGYTVEGEPKPPERAADIGGVSISENTEQRKEHENMNEPLNIKLSTREMFESGSVEGAWLKLPATAEQLNATLARIGAQGKEFIISGFESPVVAVSRLSLENVQKAGLDELNFLAAGLEKLDDNQIEKLNMIAVFTPFEGDIHHLAEQAHNTDFYTHYPDITNHAQLGEYVMKNSGLIQIPETWAGAVDFEKLGQIVAAEEHGILDEQGYLVESGLEDDAWKPVPEIPQEYRITPKFETPEIDFDAIATRTAATLTAKPAPVIPIVLTAENPRDRMKEITEKLENGIKGIFESEKYKNYLQTLSKFHNYSFNNCILIAMQKPDASHIAGFNAWRDDFKRPVRKGEKGIKILAPAPFKTSKEVDRMDADGKPVVGKDGRRVKDQVEITVPAFKVVSVFDVSQTDGEPLPQIGVNELTGSVDRYKELFAALEKSSPVPVTFEAITGGAKGYYSQTDKRIAINEGMSELQSLKTLIHEIVHSRLHDIDKNAPKDEPRPDRDTREVQAESIAFAVCAHYGLDTSDYSFGYVATWSGDKQLEALKNSLDIIRKEADAIISEVDKQFAELMRGMEQTAERPAPERQPGSENWSEPATKENAPENPGVPSDDVNKYLPPEKDAPEQGDTFTIYQLKDGDETRNLRFESLAAVTAAGLAAQLANYDKTYSAPLEKDIELKDIFFMFNMDRPEDFTGHSLSVSDVVVMNRDGKETAFYVDGGGKGFQELADFFTPKEPMRETPAPSVNLHTVADYMQKLNDGLQAVKPDSSMSVGAYNATIKRLEQANGRIPDEHPQLKALITHAAGSPDFNTLKERMNTLQSEFTQHYSTAVQMTIDTSGKAEPQKPAAATVRQNEPAPAPKAPAQGENVAAIEAKVKAGETINLSDLSDAIKKDKQAAQTSQQGKAAPQTGQTRTYSRSKGTAAKPAAPEKPSIRDEIAAGKKQLAAQKSAPAKTAAKDKNAAIGG